MLERRTVTQLAMGMSDSLVEATLALWQPRTVRTVTPEDARQIATNLVDFFEILSDWEEAESTSTDTPVDSAAEAPKGSTP